MKFTKKDFLNAKNGIIEIDEWIAVEENDLLHHTQVKSIPEVHVTGTLQFDHRSLVFSDLDGRCDDRSRFHNDGRLRGCI